MNKSELNCLFKVEWADTAKEFTMSDKQNVLVVHCKGTLLILSSYIGDENPIVDISMTYVNNGVIFVDNNKRW